MFLDTWDRIKDTLAFAQTELATSGIVLTIPEAVPRAAQAYEKFLAIVAMNPATFTQEPSKLGEYKEYDASLVFPLDIFSEPVNLDYDVRMMSNMFTVIDAVVDAFNQRPRFEDANGKGMRFIDPNVRVLLSNGSYDRQPYPSNTSDIRHHFGATITVGYIWVCPTKRS